MTEATDARKIEAKKPDARKIYEVARASKAIRAALFDGLYSRSAARSLCVVL